MYLANRNILFHPFQSEMPFISFSYLPVLARTSIKFISIIKLELILCRVSFRDKGYFPPALLFEKIFYSHCFTVMTLL